MNMDERIKRINELYHKSQNEGLTDEEKLEQTIFSFLPDQFLCRFCTNSGRSKLSSLCATNRVPSFSPSNELYHKSQNEGLTDEEKLEQTILRQEYVDSIKRNMKAQLDKMRFILSSIFIMYSPFCRINFYADSVQIPADQSFLPCAVRNRGSPDRCGPVDPAVGYRRTLYR